MILRDEAPVATIGRVVAVVTHHIVVVHPEGVVRDGLTVNEDGAVGTLLEGVPLVIVYASAVEC